MANFCSSKIKKISEFDQVSIKITKLSNKKSALES